VRFDFIERHKDHWPVRVMCRVLGVSASGFYAWRGRPASKRQERQVNLTGKIRAAHEDSRGTYGSPRLAAQLRADGEPVSVNTVAKLMRRAGIRVTPRKRFVPRTTESDPSHRAAANVLDRHFDADRPDRKWACDITYVPTLAGWLYLAVVIDLCSRRVVGWATSDGLKSELASEALGNALLTRRPGKGLLHHSDRGVQYTCDDYQRLLSDNGIEVSMSGVGQCWDNAVAESFFGTLKRELVNGGTTAYATHEQASSSLFEWIECWYNRKRLHSSLGYVSPERFEAQLN
jgi:transposase InsO family protein